MVRLVPIAWGKTACASSGLQPCSIKTGLKEYILAIAIEKIAKVDLKINGEGWSTAKEFSQVWSKHLKSIPNSVDQIAASNQSNNQKVEMLINLGTPALPFIIDKVEQGNIELFPAVKILVDDKNNINIKSINDPQEWVKQHRGDFDNLEKNYSLCDGSGSIKVDRSPPCFLMYFPLGPPIMKMT